MQPARGLSNFISAYSILRLCKAVRVQFSDPHKHVGKTTVLYIFKMISVLTFLKIVLLIISMNEIKVKNGTQLPAGVLNFILFFVSLICHNLKSVIFQGKRLEVMKSYNFL